MDFLRFFRKKSNLQPVVKSKDTPQVKITVVYIPEGYIRAGEKLMQELYEKQFGKSKS